MTSGGPNPSRPRGAEPGARHPGPSGLRSALRIGLAVTALFAAGALTGALVVALGPAQAPDGPPGASQAASSPGSPPATPADWSALAGPAARPAAASPGPGYSFRTLDDASDPAVNRLLGINDNGHIAGYFGSGAAGDPSHGYLLRPPYGPAAYQEIDFPGSAQTRLTGLNDEGVQVGFWSARSHAGQASGETGFYLMGGRFVPVSLPAGDRLSPPVNRLLGVNNHDVAVGCYTDRLGRDHGYRYDIATRSFTPVTVPGGSSVTAAAISNSGAVAGFFTDAHGVTEGFLLRSAGRLSVLSFPGAAATQALGVNDAGEVVGDYQVRGGAGLATHGFTWTPRHGFAVVDDPDGPGATTLSGVNDAGDLVGFYTDGAGNTDGLLATPGR
jgi:hypothetical protein